LRMAVPVEHPSDPRLAPFRDVARPAALEAAGLFVAEGRIVVRRLIEDARFPIAAILVTDAARDALADVLGSVSAPVYVSGQQIINGITGFNFHRGCLALARRLPSLATADGFAGASRLLALEGVGNPDNLGGLFRVASALGADGVLLDSTSGDPLYRKAVRTSMAATLRVPFGRAADFRAELTTLRSNGFRLVALTPAAGAESIDELARATHDPLVLMLGSEGGGLTPGTIELADIRARIPIDRRADSLNVVVAAGIALHALRG
jgi:tRNA G18 (ribose-2'-O)-methylase SpoU